MSIYDKENLYPDGNVFVEFRDATGEIILVSDSTEEAVALEPEAALKLFDYLKLRVEHIRAWSHDPRYSHLPGKKEE